MAETSLSGDLRLVRRHIPQGRFGFVETDATRVLPGLDELQIGAAGVHLVCADLIMQGCRVSIAAEGLHYDVIADCSGKLCRVQVKTTAAEQRDRGKNKSVFQFGLRRARGNRRLYDEGDIDVFSFAFLSLRRVAYVAIAQMRTADGHIKQTINWRSRAVGFEPRDRWGNAHANVFGKSAVRYIEDHGVLP